MAKLPNIIFFNPDQWRGDVMAHMGNPAAVTPRLDRAVAQDGFVSFRNAFCQSPFCTPSRCSFMTGWYPHVRGHRTLSHLLHPEHGEPSMLKELKDAGYFIWWGGKNDAIHTQGKYENYCDIKYWPPDSVLPMHPQETGWRGQPKEKSFYSFFVGKVDKGDADYYADEDWDGVLAACEMIRNPPKDRPLCIYLCLAYPHPPYGVEEPWFSAIQRKLLPPRIPAPKDWDAALKPVLLKGIHERQALHSWTEEEWNELRATYYGACARVDHQFGMILDALKEAGSYDDSAVFFFSDHGDFTGDYGLVEKTQNTFEDCLTHVPLLIKPPKSVPTQPRITNALAELVDVSATVYDFAHIKTDYDYFGRSLRDVLGGSETHRDAVFSEGGRRPGEVQAMELESKISDDAPESLYWPRVGLQGRDDQPWHTKAIMCRTAEAKYVFRAHESDELYDLLKDPHETRNVIQDPRYAETLAKLKDRMLRWLVETCDVVPLQTDLRK